MWGRGELVRGVLAAESRDEFAGKVERGIAECDVLQTDELRPPGEIYGALARVVQDVGLQMYERVPKKKKGKIVRRADIDPKK
eukprot:3864290-Alexandrium_andersonii.AAC.1